MRIAGSDGAISLLAIESVDDERLKAFDPNARADILLSEAAPRHSSSAINWALPIRDSR